MLGGPLEVRERGRVTGPLPEIRAARVVAWLAAHEHGVRRSGSGQRGGR